MQKHETNREFSKRPEFVEACRRAKADRESLEPSVRQASKFRRGEGLAFKHRVK